MADEVKKYLGADGISKLHELVDEEYQKKDDMPEYTLAKQNSAESGYFATYYLEKDSEQIGAKINIPKDYLVKRSEGVKTAEEDDPSGFPAGTKYIDLVINAYDESATDTHLYINVADLVDVITAGNGINVSENNEISAKVVNQNGLSVTASGITMSLVTTSAAGAMSAADKEKLDGIEDGAEVNVIEIVKVNGDALTPSNKTVDITVPTGDLADLDEVAESNLTDELAEKINGKQDELSFDGTYNPSTNKVATESTVAEAIEEVSGDIPTALSQLTGDSTHRTVTDAEKAAWNNKSDFSGDFNDLINKPTVDSVLSSTSENPVQNKVINAALGQTQGMIAPPWDAETTFNVGDVVTDNGGFYKCSIQNVGQRPSTVSTYWSPIIAGTGIITELGSNYVRWSNGLQICWDKAAATVHANTAWGNWYESESVNLGNFPKSFSTPPIVVATLGNNSAGGGLERVENTTNSNWGNTYYFRPSASTTSIVVNLIAIGTYN